MNEKCLRHTKFRSCIHCSRKLLLFVDNCHLFVCLRLNQCMISYFIFHSFKYRLIVNSTNKYLLYLEMIILESMWHNILLQRFITKYKCMLLIKEITNNCVSSATKIKCTLCSTTCLIISLFKLLASMRQIRLSLNFFHILYANQKSLSYVWIRINQYFV